MISPNTLFSIESFTKKMPSYPNFNLILHSCDNDREKAAARWAFLALDRGFEFAEVMKELRRYLPLDRYDYLALDAIAWDAWREVQKERASY
jgi:hypothetical protein